jgi:hypothetical protein
MVRPEGVATRVFTMESNQEQFPSSTRKQGKSHLDATPYRGTSSSQDVADILLRDEEGARQLQIQVGVRRVLRGCTWLRGHSP